MQHEREKTKSENILTISVKTRSLFGYLRSKVLRNSLLAKPLFNNSSIPQPRFLHPLVHEFLDILLLFKDTGAFHSGCSTSLLILSSMAQLACLLSQRRVWGASALPPTSTSSDCLPLRVVIMKFQVPLRCATRSQFNFLQEVIVNSMKMFPRWHY